MEKLVLRPKFIASALCVNVVLVRRYGLFYGYVTTVWDKVFFFCLYAACAEAILNRTHTHFSH